MAQSYENRKPKMNEHRRKILNLLEFILEVDDSIKSVFNVFDTHVAQDYLDLTGVSDKEWAEWFQDYADTLIRKGGTDV